MSVSVCVFVRACVRACVRVCEKMCPCRDESRMRACGSACVREDARTRTEPFNFTPPVYRLVISLCMPPRSYRNAKIHILEYFF